MHSAARIHIILVRTRNPLNIGAAARAMSNFGFSSLRLVNPYEPSFREARSAVGASEILKKATVHSTLAEAVADCALVVGTTAGRNRKLERLKSLAEAAPLMRRRSAKQDVALVFGSEKTGLSVEDLSYCDWSIRIPTTGSMNLGQAVGVCLYELRREKKKPGVDRTKRADGAQIERLERLLTNALAASGYIKSSRELQQKKLRELLRRLQLSEQDAELLAGMLKQIGWKIGSR